ncbi:hypothetical protein Bca101_085295 [Brassica carinata]
MMMLRWDFDVYGNGVEEYEDSLVTKLWRLPGDESKAEHKVGFTPSAQVRRQSSLTERRKIFPKSPLFFFISCSFNLPTHGSDMFVMVIFNVLLWV